LINRNVSLFLQIIESIKSGGLRKDAHIFVVSNPVDILTQLAVERSGLPWNQVYGLGTMLDTARFSSLIAAELNLSPYQVKALMLGEHGDSMFPVWSSATVNGLLLTGLPECTPSFQNAVADRARNSGAEVLKKKGGAGYAVGIAIRDVVHAVLLNKKALLPVSSLVQGAYDIRDVSISVPSVVSRKGIEKHLEIKLWPKEHMALQQSARALRETFAKVK
jgi:L-lactate dehydrogenase